MCRTSLGRGLAPIVVLSAALLSSGTPSWAADATAGRKHLRKASQFVAKGNCKAALPEFTRAYQALKDASILFNRGECYRKTNQPSKAVDDYKQFLEEIPDAPNRTQVQARIAELEGHRELPPPMMPPPAPASTVTSPVAPPAAAPASPVAAPAANTAPPPAAPEPLLPLGDSGSSTTVALTSAPPATGESESGGLASKAWFWVILGVAVAGAGAAGWLVLNSNETDVPSSRLGSYRF